jgi:NADH-quinone oxidoreductase subunit M
MYFLISVWGGERRKYAAAKFFIYTFAGSIFMLVGMVALAYLHYRAAGSWSFSLVHIQAAVANGTLWAGALQAQTFIFWAFALAFLIKAPAFPFHTWLPDAYAESPVVGPILSSVMVKMGSYGLLRFCLPLFPDVLQRQIPILMALAVIGILYGGVLAAVQKDMRRMLAYSSLSHMGFVLLGIFSLDQLGLIGGSYQQLSHGITASAMFLLVGYLIQRRGTADFSAFGGLKAQMPTFAALFLISMLASVGLPGLNGFIGEFFALMGAFRSGFAGVAGLNTIYASLAGAGVVLAAVYLLYMYQQVFYGPITQPINARLKDLKPWEMGLAGVLVFFMLWGGLAPSTFTRPMEASLAATRDMALLPKGERPTWTPTAAGAVALKQ